MHVGSSGVGRKDVERGEVAERPGGTVGKGRGGASLRMRSRLRDGAGAGLDGPSDAVLGPATVAVVVGTLLCFVWSEDLSVRAIQTGFAAPELALSFFTRSPSSLASASCFRLEGIVQGGRYHVTTGSACPRSLLKLNVDQVGSCSLFQRQQRAHPPHTAI